VSGTATVSASAGDNVGVAGVQFRLDGQPLGAEDTTAPFSVAWSSTGSANGSHSITAVARDAAGNATTSAAVGVTVSNAAPVGILDDFAAAPLDPAWTFTNPGTNSSASLTGNAGHLRISSPASTVHDCWADDASCPRVMRTVANGDAVYETRIDGASLSRVGHSFGILLWQNSTNFIRFEFRADGTGAAAAAWRTIAGAGSNAIPPGRPPSERPPTCGSPGPAASTGSTSVRTAPRGPPPAR
jgi:hypothetical protein